MKSEIELEKLPVGNWMVKVLFALFLQPKLSEYVYVTIELLAPTPLGLNDLLLITPFPLKVPLGE